MSAPTAEIIAVGSELLTPHRIDTNSLFLTSRLNDAGVRVIEITFDAPSAAANVALLRARLDARRDGPFILGAGTIMNGEQLAAARSSGADFGVSPVLDLDLLRRAIEDAFPFLAGGMTPNTTPSTRVWPPLRRNLAPGGLRKSAASSGVGTTTPRPIPVAKKP